MAIKHLKVSAASAPGDPDLVGGPDWNAAHVEVGPHYFMTVVFKNWVLFPLADDGSSGNPVVPPINLVISPGDIDGIFDLTFDPSYGITLVGSNCVLRPHIDGKTASMGFYLDARILAANVIRIEAYTGDWVLAWPTDYDQISVDIFKHREPVV